MTLAVRLLLAFGAVTVLLTVLFDIGLRWTSRGIIQRDFDDRIEAVASGVRKELVWESQDHRDLLPPLCASDTFFDKVLLDLGRAHGDASALDPERRIALRHFVPEQARALRLDDLALATGDGAILGASDVSRIGTRDARLAALLKTPPAVRLRPASAGGALSLEVHCTGTKDGVTLGLVGARAIGRILERVGPAYGVQLAPVDAGRAPPASDTDHAVRLLDFAAEVPGLRVSATASRGGLNRALEEQDHVVLAAGAAGVAFALLVAFLVSRSLSRPIVALARETREVVSGQPRLVRGRGGREIAELAAAFNRTLDELTAMRKRVAATERIAARREVSRQIAHEIKNPLAPIRAAVETLRRLRARDDPAFDEYFEEATATVLGEVHRIANIVSEFTRFARLPPPTLEPIDLVAIARRVVTLHASAPDGSEPTSPRVELNAEPIPAVMADKDQMIQVLTNLIQNGLEAAGAIRPDPRVVVSLAPLARHRVRLVVRDNGPGVPETLEARLFEPYVTTKEKGTGLGLAIVQRIVFEHGGEITYRKAAKGGAVFEIALPLGGPPLLERPPSSLEATGPRDEPRG